MENESFELPNNSEQWKESDNSIQKELPLEDILKINNDNDNDTEYKLKTDNDKDNPSYKFANETYNNLSEENIKNIKLNKRVLPTKNRDDLISELNGLSKNKTFDKNVEDPDKLENILIKMIEMYSSQFDFCQKTLKYLKKNNQQIENKYPIPSNTDEDNDETDNITSYLKDSYPQFSKSLNGATLKGKDVELYTLTEHHNIKMTYLPNSGFYTLIRCPTLAELNNLYNRLIDNLSEYNYLFGAFAYLFHDLKIKEIFIDFIKQLICSANIKNYNKGDTFQKNVSFHDYNVLLHSVASLMFKSGYEYKQLCTNTKCNHVETVNINVDLLKQYILSAIPTKCIQTLTDKKIKSSSQLEQYREDLELTSKFTPYKNHIIYLKVPTLQSFFNYGDQFNAELIENIHDITDNAKINTYIKYSYFKLFIPWIDKIEILNDDNTINYIVNDIKGISFILDQIQNDYNDTIESFINPIVDFIKSSQLTLIALPVNPCPKCNTLPDNNIGGYIPIDIQDDFFSMLTMKLLLK